jgi:hypothetical protein
VKRGWESEGCSGVVGVTVTPELLLLPRSPLPAPQTRYLDITVPPWQGHRVPLLIFKVFASGTTAGSDPFYVDIAAPTATSAAGTTGVMYSPLQPVVAAANGTSRIRITGDNVGRVGTKLIFLNSFTSRIVGEFSDCERDFGYVVMGRRWQSSCFLC